MKENFDQTTSIVASLETRILLAGLLFRNSFDTLLTETTTNIQINVCICVCVCVSERERERESGRERSK